MQSTPMAAMGRSNEDRQMVKNSTQNWTPGAIVKVGFLSLRVVRCIPTPGDYAPDEYELASLDGRKLYSFVPHHGLCRI